MTISELFNLAVVVHVDIVAVHRRIIALRRSFLLLLGCHELLASLADVARQLCVDWQPRKRLDGTADLSLAVALVVDRARASDEVSLVVFFAQLSRDGNGFLDTVVPVGTSKTAHGTGHANALVPFVSVSKPRILGRINRNGLLVTVANSDHAGVASEPLDRVVVLGHRRHSRDLLVHMLHQLVAGDVDRGVVVRHPLLGRDEVAARLVDGWNIFGSLRFRNVLRRHCTVLRLAFAAAHARFDRVIRRIRAVSAARRSFELV